MIDKATGILVWLGVSDLKKSAEFYSDALGLNLDHADDESGWVEFNYPQGGARIGLRLADKDEIVTNGGATLAFDVANLEVAMQTMTDQGVAFITGAMSLNGYQFATFIDPDGNQLQLRQVK